MFGSTGGFSGMANSMEPCKMLWPCCCHGNKILANLGYSFHKIAYKSACMRDRPDVFGPTRGDDMATTFALGAECNRLLACLLYTDQLCSKSSSGSYYYYYVL